ncbi:MAG: hypothetical protein RIS44_1635 [Pseudomonadota bacterium]
MSFIESLRRWGARLLALSLAACSSSVPQREPVVSPTPAPTPGKPSSPERSTPVASVAPAAKLAPATASRNWDEFRKQAGRRLVAANPQLSYTGVVPDQLLAIPVITVELNADGSIRRMEVMRHPTQAQDTTQLAMDALRRAAPFGDISRLPKPWKFNETFLFNDDRHFKPRSLD